jgi:hypothetical protein
MYMDVGARESEAQAAGSTHKCAHTSAFSGAAAAGLDQMLPGRKNSHERSQNFSNKLGALTCFNRPADKTALATRKSADLLLFRTATLAERRKFMPSVFVDH